MRGYIAIFCAAFGLLPGSAANQPALADPVADFYKGRQLQVVVGYGAGGGYDVYARLVARHLGKHIPGQPNAIVQNMPGAGSLRAVNYLFNTAPKDGSTIGTFARNMPLMGILGGNANVHFDPRKFTWLGSPSSSQDEAYVLFVRKDAKAKSLEDARRPGGPELVLGGTAEGASGNDIALLIRDAVGVNLRLIAGYPDSNALFIAIDRGELDGRFVGSAAVASTHPEWLRPGSTMHPLIQFARTTRHPDFPDAPTARELARDARARQLIELAEIPYMLSRPYVGPPDIQADRAKALQAAFMALGKDQEFLSDAGKMRVDVSPVGPDEALRMLDMLANAPQDLKDEIRRLQANGG
jgi:tripartite-type tricarboxylate transporter receptor subunit TctC